MRKARLVGVLMLSFVRLARSFSNGAWIPRLRHISRHRRCCDDLPWPIESSLRHSHWQIRAAADSTLPSSLDADDSFSSLQSTPKILTGAERGAAKEAARARRKKLLGVAKAVDRGIPNVVTYKPATLVDGIPLFQSLSGLPDRSKPFTVLGIESSCDDTGAAVVRSDGVILGESLAKQYEIHEAWGGVVPGLARDAHVQAIDRVIDSALRNANLTSVAQVDAIAVTIGPGLEICLRVGCEKAVALATQFQKPFVGVHHLEAHILMARLPHNDTHTRIALPATGLVHQTERTVDFPFLALLVSGGHCQILQCNGIGQYHILGGTLDDSLGEAYDKTARLLGLPVGGGGGPAVEKLARTGDPSAIPLSVPMQSRKDCDFSFAGLKTNVRRAGERLVAQHNEQAMNGMPGTRAIATIDQLPDPDKANIAASFQNVAIRHIEDRLQRAMNFVEATSEDRGRIRTLAVVGGVAANQELRSRLQALCSNRAEPWTMLVPPPRLCTDQGAYVHLFR
jgi:N6-L-threonylcarbamoyladenine synthase